MFLMRFGKKAGISLAIFALSYVPVVGRLVLPAASFYTFKSVAGLGPAAVVFGTGILLPRRYLVIFLQSYFASRSLMRELVRRIFCFMQMLSNGVCSSNLIFLVFDLPKSRKSNGSTIERASCLVSALVFISS